MLSSAANQKDAARERILTRTNILKILFPRFFERKLNPLGKGFDPYSFLNFLSVYVQSQKGDDTTPDLRATMPHFEKIDGIAEMLGGLPRKPLCLIDGCSSPYNGTALKRFMQRHGFDPTIHAIDLTDFEWALGLGGIGMKDMKFMVEDATATSYPDASVDLVHQDFLLNCSPHRSHLKIMGEVARILQPEGVALVCFTDNQCVMSNGKKRTLIAHSRFADRFGIPFDRDAYCISDISPTRTAELRDELTGKVIVSNDSDEFTFVTESGNFEFFSAFSTYARIFQSAGLTIKGASIDRNADRQGLPCVRYRVVLKKLSEESRAGVSPQN